MKITYRNGVPTKKSLRALCEAHSTQFIFVFGGEYGEAPNPFNRRERKHFIYWQGMLRQNHVEGFIEQLHAQGIKTGKYRPYVQGNALTGELEILAK